MATMHCYKKQFTKGPDRFPQVETWEQICDYVLGVQVSGTYTAKAYTIRLSAL